MINVKPSGNSLFPVVCPALLYDQVNRISLTPFVQNSLFIQKNVGGGGADRCFLTGVLINKTEFSIQIKNKAAAVVQRSFEDGVAARLQAWIQETSDIGE